jgi:hypothetical protein
MLTQQESVNMTLEKLLKPNETYFRINPKLKKSIPLDKLGKENVRVLTEAAQSKFSEIDKFVQSDMVRKKLEELD